MSRSRSTMMNWLSSVLFTLVTMATGFLTTPLILEPLGIDRFGLVRTLIEVFAYFTLIAQGLSVSLVPLLARSIGVKDRDAARRYLAAGLWCYGGAVCLILFVGVVALPGLPTFFPVAPNLLRELQMAWAINLLGLPLVLAMPLKLVVEIHHRGYLVNLAQLTQALITAVLSVALVWNGWGMPGVMAANVAGAFVFALITLTINRWKYQDLLGGVHRVKVSRGDVWSIASLSWPTFITMVSQRIGMLSDSIFLLAILGPAAAAVLFLNKRLATIIEGVLRSFSAASWPALVELNARGERDLFNRRLEELSRIVVTIAIAALVPAVCFNEQFVTLWVGPTGEAGTWIAAVGSLNALLVTLSSIFTVPLVTTGNVKMLAVPSMIAAGVNVVVSVAMTYVLGPIGPLVGTTVALSTVNLWHYPRFLQQTFGTSPSRIFRACLPPVAWGVPFAGVMALLALESQRLLPRLGRFPGLFMVIGLMGCGSLLFVIFSFGVILSAEERALWKARLLTPLLRRFGR